MGENISIQEKITVWLNKHPEYRTKTEDEIISAMLSAEDNNLTLNELQELSLFATSALQPEIAGLELEKSSTSPQPFTPTKEEETNLLQVLEERVRSTETKTEGEKEKNGFIAKAWSFLKNTKLLDWCTDSTNDIKKAREEELKLLQTGNVSQIFKDITGVEYTKENVEKFLNGEIKTKSEQALDAYTEGQEMAVDVTGDLVSGIAAVGIYTAAIVASPFTGGASIALGVGLATVSGGLIKTGVKALDSVTGGREYDTFSKDFATGSFSGLLAPVTAGLGGAVGKVVAKTFGVQAVKTIGKETVTQTGLKAFAKSALLNPAGYEYKGGTMIARAVSQGTEMATDGALGGGIDNAFRAGIEGEDIGEGFISGLIGGAAMAPVIGGGFKAAGKMGNKFGNLFHSKNVDVNPDKALPDGNNTQSKADINPKSAQLAPEDIFAKLKNAALREEFAALREEIKKITDPDKKKELEVVYLKLYNEWTKSAQLPDIRMEYTPDNTSANKLLQTETEAVKDNPQSSASAAKGSENPAITHPEFVDEVTAQNIASGKLDAEHINDFIQATSDIIKPEDYKFILRKLTNKKSELVQRIVNSNNQCESRQISKLLYDLKSDSQVDTLSRYLNQFEAKENKLPDFRYIWTILESINKNETLVNELLNRNCCFDVVSIQQLANKIADSNVSMEPLYKILDGIDAKKASSSFKLDAGKAKENAIYFYAEFCDKASNFSDSELDKIYKFIEEKAFNEGIINILSDVIKTDGFGPRDFMFALENVLIQMHSVKGIITIAKSNGISPHAVKDFIDKCAAKWNLDVNSINKDNYKVLTAVSKINDSYDFDVLPKDVILRLLWKTNYTKTELDENEIIRVIKSFINNNNKLIVDSDILSNFLSDRGKNVIEYFAAKGDSASLYRKTASDLYEDTFNKYFERGETFGCKTFNEFEEYLKTCTNRAEAGKLLGKIRKETLDDFMAMVPDDMKRMITGKSGTFTAADFDKVLAQINSDNNLQLIFADLAAGKNIPRDVNEFAICKFGNDPLKNHLWHYLVGKNGFEDFNRQFASAQELWNFYSDKIKNSGILSKEQLKEDLGRFEIVVSELKLIMQAQNMIGKGNLSALLHNESVVKCEGYMLNIRVLASCADADTWRTIFHAKGTSGVMKDNEFKQLLALSAGLRDNDLEKIYNSCYKDGVFDVKKALNETKSLIGTYLGGKYADTTPQFEGWDIDYLPYILSVLKPRTLKDSDNALLRNLITSSFDGNYKEFLFNPNTPNGALNIQTRKKYQEAGLNFEQWMNYDGVREFEFKPKPAGSNENIIKSLNTDLNIIYGNENLKNLLSKYIADSDVAYDGVSLYSKSGGEIKNKDLLDFTNRLIKFAKECGMHLKNANLLDLKDHFAARLKSLKEYSSVPESEKLSISLWKRDTKHDLFQGHYCQCCISLDGCNNRAIVHSLSHVVDNIIELKNASGETIGKAKVLWMTDNVTNEPVLLVNGFEITGNKAYNNQVRDEFVGFMKDYAKAVSGKDVPIVTGRTYQKINYEELPEFTSNINLIGDFPDNTYHLDSFHELEDSWPTNLDKPKNLTTKILYMPDNYWAKNIELTSRINSKINTVVDRLKGIEGISSVHEVNLAEFIKSVEGYTFKEKEILEDNIDIFLKKLNKLDNPAEKSAEISLAFDILTDASAKERVNRFSEKLGETTLRNSETNTSFIAKLFDLGSDVEMTGKGMWLVSGSENSIYGRINGRGKSVSSIESKLVKEILDLEVKDLTDATLTNLVKDSYGFRVIPGPVQRADIDVKTILRNAAQTHKDQFEDSSIPLEDALSDFYTNGFNGAIWKQLSDKQRLAVRDIAIENRSDAFVDKIIELVSAGKIDISKISNYSTSLDEKLPYFTANQLYKISDAVEARTGKKIPVVSYDGDDFIHKGSTRDSGYTAGQMNLKVVGSDDLMELQFRDSEVDIFAELEHVPYDIQENKLTVRGSKYDAHRKVLNNLDTAGQKLYEKYRSDVYTYYRLKALGVQNCTKPDIVQMFEDAIRRGEKVFKEDYTTSAERNGQLNLISENGLKELHET